VSEVQAASARRRLYLPQVQCIHCQGEMRKGTTPFHVDRKGCHVLLDTVPAWVCQQCGEAYFEENEVVAIQDLINSVEQKADALAATA
jgi:YgiT-type zinc finger domain-containing protein